MAFDYRILAKQEPETETNVMYPRIDAKSVPVLDKFDGPNPVSFPVTRVFAQRLQNGEPNRITALGDVDGVLTLTAQRAIVVVPHLNKVKWIDSSSTDMAVFGVGTTIAVDLAWNGATKLIRKARGAPDPALTGHLYYPWISSVQYKPAGGRKDPAALRLGTTCRINDDPPRDLLLYLVFHRSIDTADVATQTLSRIAAWHLAAGGIRDAKTQAGHEQLRDHPTITPPSDPGRFSAVSLKRAVPARPQNLPIPLFGRYAAERATEEALEAEQADAASLSRDEICQRFRSLGPDTTPRFEFLATAGDPPFWTPAGVEIDADGLVVPPPATTPRAHLRCGCWLWIVASTNWRRRAGKGSEPRISVQGTAEVLVSDDALTFSYRTGRSIAGPIDPATEVIVARFDLTEVDALTCRDTEFPDGTHRTVAIGRNHLGVVRLRPPDDEDTTFDADGLAILLYDLISARRGVPKEEPVGEGTTVRYVLPNLPLPEGYPTGPPNPVPAPSA